MGNNYSASPRRWLTFKLPHSPMPPQFEAWHEPHRSRGVKGPVMIDAPLRASYSYPCMRVLLAGLLLLCLTGAAFAQDAEGEVESIGFGGAYRPNCWTAMKLRLRP